MTESVADNPENRKAGKAAVVAVIDDDSSKAVYLKKRYNIVKTL